MSIRPVLRLAAGLALAAACAVPSLGDAGVPAGPVAAGYVPDRECALCHRDETRSFREVGMGRSFEPVATAVRDGLLIEDFDAPAFHHAPSHRWYRILRAGGGLVFRRWQLDDSGRKLNVFEQPIDYILGSGNHSRVYLYRTPVGELFQLPLAWYSQENGGRGGWGMSPGYDHPDHPGVTRLVHPECMFCHNAYPDAAAAGESPGVPDTFPARLPEGIGCQRCHGPGADHVRLALDSQAPDSMIRSAIVNPARLSPGRRNDVCYQCHLLPSFSIAGIRRFGRGAYSFRPGQVLDDFRVLMDIREADRKPSERFEIDHQAYRLEQSHCFQASGGALSCLSCHDPHRKVPAADRPAHYRKVCLGCHDGALADHPAVHRPGAEAAAGAAPLAVRDSDCVRCHMPPRRAEDVVHTVMTDHRIQRPPADLAALLAPLQERETDLQDVLVVDTDGAPSGRLAGVYRAVAAIGKQVAVSDAVDFLEANLAGVAPEAREAWLALARGQIQLHRWKSAEATLRRALALTQNQAQNQAQDEPEVRANLALALAGEGKPAAAEAVFRGLVTDYPKWPDTLAGLGRILLGQGRMGAAIPYLRRATDEGPNRAVAWDALGAAELALHHPAEATEDFRRALEVDPTRAPTYLRLADALVAQGRRDEALRYLRVGAATAAEPKEIEARIERLQAVAPAASQGSRR